MGIDGSKCFTFHSSNVYCRTLKRKKLVHAFEDKVKQVLVGISQENEAILEPIIEKLEPTDGQVIIPEEEKKELNVSEDPLVQPHDSVLKPFDFKFFSKTWNGIKECFGQTTMR